MVNISAIFQTAGLRSEKTVEWLYSRTFNSRNLLPSTLKLRDTSVITVNITVFYPPQKAFWAYIFFVLHVRNERISEILVNLSHFAKFSLF